MQIKNRNRIKADNKIGIKKKNKAIKALPYVYGYFFIDIKASLNI